MKNPTKKMLIIDDSEDDRELYRYLLRSDEVDWKFIEVESGDAGIEICNVEKLDCVLLDYSLPGRDGLKVLEELGEMCGDLPIVMLTGQGNEAIAVEAMRMGAQDYLNKNILTPHSIQRAVHNAIDVVAFKRKIEDQQEELARFANVLAHDLKEPARSIAMLLEHLKGNIANSLDLESTEYMDLIANASVRMIKLIDTVSSYTFIDKQAPKYEKFLMEDAIKGALVNLEARLAEKSAVVTYDPMPLVYGDKWQVTQLLQNLIGNGIKYCKEEQPTVHISSCIRNEEQVFSVRDNGIGMEPEYLDKIFEAFKRLHTNQEFEGTGLGLATCRKIVQRHDGEIWCDSEVDKGSTFYFSLPLKTADIA